MFVAILAARARSRPQVRTQSGTPRSETRTRVLQSGHLVKRLLPDPQRILDRFDFGRSSLLAGGTFHKRFLCIMAYHNAEIAHSNRKKYLAWGEMTFHRIEPGSR